MPDVFYRKYRPQKFGEVLGQEHIVRALEGAMESGSLAHAFLFSGSRGTGKTTIARLLAKALGASADDLIEMDAASNRGIDEIRELREGVHTLPFNSPKKVYIIDEAHMLTKDAANALLKTLEEPPEHVVFILATTEPEKLPETIHSRCQSFTFRRPPHQVVVKMVTAVAKKEGRALEKPAAELIALLADGSFRDAHGVLQLVLSSSKEQTITREMVAEVTGSPRTSHLRALLSGISGGDIERALEALDTARAENIEAKTLLMLLIARVRMVLLYRIAPALAKQLGEGYSEEEQEVLKKLASESESAITSKSLARLLEAQIQMLRAHDPYTVLELALIELSEKE